MQTASPTLEQRARTNCNSFQTGIARAAAPDCRGARAPFSHQPDRLRFVSSCGLLDADFQASTLDYEDLIKAAGILCHSPAASQETFRRAAASFRWTLLAGWQAGF